MNGNEVCRFCGQDDPFVLFPCSSFGTIEFVCEICVESGRPSFSDTISAESETRQKKIEKIANSGEEKPDLQNGQVERTVFIPRKPSAQLAACLQQHIDTLDPDPFYSSATFAFKKINALPIHFYGLYLWAIKPDGTILCKDLDSSSGPETETNPVQIREVLEHGATKYPELYELLTPEPCTDD